ncbi:hypothetical protein KTT_21170 [Tengunoibacter tsumagoiensis]|uniref:Uncharacterized protein n=2 Tax=Tengunoibacter tsumagoiensis TaxID=2014871 RepID=A0A401ZZH4_9CHLR|nr:hypothetical protein KTT_21170 [Tengunoibacter tsumagoiensis]
MRQRYSQLSTRRKALLIVLLIAILLPSFSIIIEGISGLLLYNHVRSGIAHLKAAQNAFSGGEKDDASKYFDPTRLKQAQSEINAAHDDFVSVRDDLDQDAGIGLVGLFLPSQIKAARALGHIGVDATEAGQIFIKTAINQGPTLQPALKNPLGGDELAPKPYLTQAGFKEIMSDLDAIAPLVHDMNIQSQGVSLSGLPLSSDQQKQLQSILPILPVLDNALGQIRGMSDELSWILGIDQQRTFLVEPMDRAELRATGGFTGQFGELALSGGHMSPLKLKNIGQFEEVHPNVPIDPVFYKVSGQTAPDPFTWWPIGNFGLRDANVSADFPTSAKIMMDRYTYDFDRPLDGIIIFTPTLIKHVLHATGPITIDQYNETITEQNLEDRLHYYQLNNDGIRKAELIEHEENTEIARKLFTQRVTQTLMKTVQKLPPDKLVALGNEMLVAMKEKDLQAYFTNPQVEALLGKFGSTASMDRSNNHDGLFLVQTNLSANKASQFTTTSIQDSITLDDKGGATHNVQLTLDYQKKGDVYGPDTYHDYIRFYTPTTSKLLDGNGFSERGRAFCAGAGEGYKVCKPDVFGDGSLVCQPPIKLGYATSTINDPYVSNDNIHPVEVTGPPTNKVSDEEGRNMYAGWAIIPANCTLKMTLSWYVPPSGQQPYTFLMQNQASITAQVDLTVKPAAGTCGASKPEDLHYKGTTNGQDTTFVLNQQGSSCSFQLKN